MIVEFTGATGSGKSTLSCSVIELLSKRNIIAASVHEKDFPANVLRPVIADISSHNIKTDLFIFPWFLLGSLCNLKFAWFCLMRITRYGGSFSESSSILRSFIRKLGIFYYLKSRRFANTCCVVDEGIVHSAHNILVNTLKQVPDCDIKKFSELVPLPDIIVYVRADINTLSSRILDRNDRSPRVKSDKQALTFANNAHAAFKVLFNSQRLSAVTLSYDADIDSNAPSKIAEEISKSMDKLNAPTKKN